MPSPERPISPHDIVEAGLCIGCGGCAALAGSEASMRFDAHGFLKPSGGGDWIKARSREFARTCPFSPSARNEDEIAATLFAGAKHIDGRIGRFEAAYVGHVAEGDYRAQGSSGGLVSWTAAELLRRRMVDRVAHVGAVEGEAGAPLFRYRLSQSEDEIRAHAKSRYYPVDLADVIRDIKAHPGATALVGAPCFVKAIHLLREDDPVLAERLVFTLGLFCGHMKSARMVESFAWQMDAAGDDVHAIDFRRKDPSRPANWYRAAITLRDGREISEDWMRFADGDWGAGFFQNPACNFCDDVAAETADISFGDAWVEPYASDGRGTNVVVIRTPSLHGLVQEAIDAGRLALAPVDADFIHATQAAGFRQRREGLALRLSLRGGKLMPRKRVAATRPPLSPRREAVYRMRALITYGSRLVFSAARRLRRPRLYLTWARAMLGLYQALAWSQGRLGRWIDRLEGFASRRARR